jgi:hypothetical protein
VSATSCVKPEASRMRMASEIVSFAAR